MSSSCSRRTRKRASPSPPAPEIRDWATLPVDALLEVFLRLDAHDIFLGVEIVCKAWRRVAVEEPKLWRRVDMTSVPLEYMDVCVRDAVDRSKGLLEAFSGPWEDESLHRIADGAPSLKSLHLSYDDDATYETMMFAIKKLPLLEYIDISPPFYSLSTSDKLFESVCKACPLLKDLKIRFTPPPGFDFDEALLMERVDGDMYRTSMMPELRSMEIYNYDGDMYRTSMMPELRSMEIYNYVFNNKQLEAILDNCPLLESLHITGHEVDGVMDENLRAKCARIKNLSIPFEFNPREEDPGDSDFSYEDEP